MSYNKLKSLVANVEAIETAMKIQVQGRQATAEEKEILSRYSGFGGIKEVLNIGTDKPIGGDMQEPIQRLQELINAYPHFTEPMRHNVIEGIKASVLTAFYTPKFLVDAVVRQIHATFSENGLKMRSFLEPSAGIGGFLPIAMSGTYDYAIEKDLISGMILSLLHENTLTRTAAFETIGEQGFEHTTFDVIASNIPFGNFRVFDAELWKKGGMYEQATKTIHNYFFVKAMELLNEGGLLAFITSRGIADTPGNKFVREYLVNHADLISAIRLPDMLFMQTSGIEVGSDLLIFQKHTHKTVLSQREQLFLQVGREKADAIGTMTEYANKLFTMPKTTLATGSRIVQNQYGKYVRKYQWQGNENAMSQYLAALLKLDFGRYFRKSLFTGNGQGSEHMQMSLFGNVAMKQVEKGKRAYTDGVEAWMKDGAMVLFEGQVGTIQYRKSSLYQEVAIDFVLVDEGKVNTDRAKDYFPIRKAYFELSIKEREEQKEDNGLRRELNARYDAFVAKWGCFHENDNKEFIMLDSLGVEVFTIEMQLGKDLVKSDIMREPVAFKKIDPNKRLTPIEALASSLNFYGKVDMDYLMQSTDSAEEEIIGDLKGEIFYNPAIGEWEHKGKFLSGNVIAKCKEIGSYLSELTDREKDWTETAVKGSNAILDKWSKMAYENKVFLVTDFQDLETPDDVVDIFFNANHTSGDVFKSNTIMTCNWLLGRQREESVGEEENLYIPPSSSLAGKIYNTLMSQVVAGKKFGGLNEVESVRFDLRKSEISELERMGLVPMVNEYSKVMAFSAKTLFNGDNLGLQTYSVVRVFDYITKVLIDFLNRRAFENWTTRTEADLRGQVVKFLDSVMGPNKLIERFKVMKIEQDPNQKDRVLLDIHITPYFPAKSFVIQLAGHKGDNPEDAIWESEYHQE